MNFADVAVGRRIMLKTSDDTEIRGTVVSVNAKNKTAWTDWDDGLGGSLGSAWYEAYANPIKPNEWENDLELE